MKKLTNALCALLAVVMLISAFPMSISAAGDYLDLYYNTNASVSTIKDKTNCNISYDGSTASAYVFATGSAPTATLPVSGYADGLDYAVITTKVPGTNSAGASKGTVEFKNGGSTVVSKSLYWVRGYKFYSAIIDVSDLSSCDSIVINFFNDSIVGDTARLYSVSFCKTAEAASAKAAANEKAANGDIVSMYTETQLGSKSYVQEDYCLPYWDTPIVYNENVYPLCNPDGSIDDIELMYDIDRLVSVKNYELTVEYKEGVDYELVDGKLRILQSGSIPTVPFTRHYFTYEAGGTYRLLQPFSGYTHVRFEEGYGIPTIQLAITYTHTDEWTGFVPPNQGEKLPRTTSILENGGDLDIVLFGDSITNGGNSSGKIGMLPYAEDWTEMFEAELKKTYPSANISVTNTSVSGGSMETAKENVYNAITPYNPDLLVIALGTNDYQFRYSASKVLGELDYVLDAVKEECPQCEVIIVSPMLSNPECFDPELLYEYAEGYYQRAEWYGNAAIADVTQIHDYLLQRKSYTDMSANNICHLNDFFARVYVHVVLKTIKANSASDNFKAQSVSRLDYITNKSFYFDAEVAQIESIIAEAKAAMNSATTTEQIRQIYTKAKAEICIIPRKFDVVCANTDFTNIIFDNELKASLFTGPHYVSSVFNSGEPAVELTMTNGSDPYINLTYSDKYPVNADDNKYVVMTYKVPYSNSSASNNTQLYFCAGDVIAPASACSYTFSPVKDGNYHSVIVDLSEASWWEGIIHKIRIAPFASCSAYDKMFIYSVSLAQTEVEANKLAVYNEENANHTYQPPSHTVVFTNESAIEHASAPTISKLAGDGDGNGKINSKDALYLKKYQTNTLTNTAIDIDALDINRDNRINAMDAIRYKKVISASATATTYDAPGTDTDVVFDSEEYALRVGDTAGKYLYLNAEHELESPKYAVVVYKGISGNGIMNIYAGDKVAADKKSSAPVTAGDNYKYIIITLPEGFDGKGVTLDVTGFELYIDSFGFFEDSSNISSFFAGREKERLLQASENIEITFTDEVMTQFDYANHTAYSNTNPANVLKLTVDEDRIDPYIYLNVEDMGISADEYKYIVYSYRLPTSTSNYTEKAQLFLCSDGAEFPAEASSIKFNLNKTGGYINEVIDLTDASYWNGNALGIRIDYFCNAQIGDTCYIRSLTFCKTPEDVEMYISTLPAN